MSIQINYKKSYQKKDTANLILFVDEKFNISNIKKHISNSEYSIIADLLKNRDFKKEILIFDINSKKKIILVSIKKNITDSETENLGAKFYNLFKDEKSDQYIINSDSITNKSKNIVGYFLHGLKLKSYIFEKYKSKKNKKKY